MASYETGSTLCVGRKALDQALRVRHAERTLEAGDDSLDRPHEAAIAAGATGSTNSNSG